MFFYTFDKLHGIKVKFRLFKALILNHLLQIAYNNHITFGNFIF